jgi:protein PhnA
VREAADYAWAAAAATRRARSCGEPPAECGRRAAGHRRDERLRDDGAGRFGPHIGAAVKSLFATTACVNPRPWGRMMHAHSSRRSCSGDTDVTVRDCNGNELKEGDAVQVTKDLRVRGSSDTLKRGTTFKNIRLTDDMESIECGQGRNTVVLKTCFLKKA